RAAARVLHARRSRNNGATMSEFTSLAALDADNVMQTYGRLPVAFVRGEGSYLWDSEGRRYLDFLGGLAVTSLGHAHPEVAAATGQPQKQETFQPLPSGFRQVAYDDLGALEGALDERVAAVMLEAVQGEGGVVPASPEYLRAVRRLCDEREALLIIDEVQCGL